mgnify:CR=1 FL=1
MSSGDPAAPNQFTAEFMVYSPRWGHPDPYIVIFTQDEATVRRGIRSATCRLDSNGDPVWDGDPDQKGTPLLDIFAQDWIYPPVVVPLAIDAAWRRWRESVVDEQTLREGLKELFNWIDETARRTPSGDLWEGVF